MTWSGSTTKAPPPGMASPRPGFSAWEVRTPDDATVASGFGVAEIADERITRMWTVLYAPE
ncbi:MAG TPA: hypothetical protein VL634_06575 [Mycobacterium sp.]|nr:hypothetical protein [Mycobacterium sp.]